MIKRFWDWLTKPKPFVPCEVCNILRDQLSYERARYQELQEVMVSLLKPIPIIRNGAEQTPKPISTVGKTWARRQKELEQRDRVAARIVKTSPVAAKSDDEIKAESKPAEPTNPNVVTPTPPPMTVEQLELTLGVVDGGEVH